MPSATNFNFKYHKSIISSLILYLLSNPNLNTAPKSYYNFLYNLENDLPYKPGAILDAFIKTIARQLKKEYGYALRQDGTWPSSRQANFIMAETTLLTHLDYSNEWPIGFKLNLKTNQLILDLNSEVTLNIENPNDVDKCVKEIIRQFEIY